MSRSFFTRSDLPQSRYHLLVYREWKGLNSTTTDQGDRWQARDIEGLCPGLVFLDLKQTPTMTSQIATIPAVNGSIFEYANIAKSTITLSFWLHFRDNESFITQKSEFEGFWAQSAIFHLIYGPHRGREAGCVFQKFSDWQVKGPHDALISVTLVNPSGMWRSTFPSDEIQADKSQHWLNDLEWPENTTENMNWTLQEGTNSLIIPGDYMIKLSNPSQPTEIRVNGVHGDVEIINHTTGTQIGMVGSGTPRCRWINLDLHDSDDKPVNINTTGTDLWFDPGQRYNGVNVATGTANEIELKGAASAQISTYFYFADA